MGYSGSSLVAQMVKHLPAMQETQLNQETQVRSLGWEDPFEKETVTYSNILASEILWTEKPPGLRSMGLQRVGHNLPSKRQQRINRL